MKKAAALLILAMAASMLHAAPFTDSLGRTVELPERIERIVPSGNLSQMVLYSIAPEMLTGWSQKLSGSAKEEFFRQDTVNLPIFGTFYGKKANLNKEALMSAAPDAVIDMGELKGSLDSMRNDLDSLSGDIMIPVIFIEAYLENTPEVYRTLGTLLGKEEEAEPLAAFAEEALQMAEDARGRITDPVTVYYASSPDGLEAVPEGSFHGEVIEKIGARNVVPRSFGANKGTVSMEQVYLWNPDVILLSDSAAYDEVTGSAVWASLDAVRNGRVYLVPEEPYSFIDNPPATNRIIGIYWLGSLLYPELYPVDIIEKAKEYYRLYYGFDLTDGRAASIMHLS